MTTRFEMKWKVTPYFDGMAGKNLDKPKDKSAINGCASMKMRVYPRLNNYD
ncbi:hypothetical protein GCM10010981_09360 [Dyella nitratireducens]|uniref:Uncharacterized protein n=1 Tax=Dyella nitratireducens TaxID=1849580 RepID=A0ABQ1FMV5_9GAMM|nr:hypothetical protein GCM10010981_09360 [Dyella nitratireducens]